MTIDHPLERFGRHRESLKSFMYSGSIHAIRVAYLGLAHDLFKAAKYAETENRSRLIERAKYYLAIAQQLEASEDRVDKLTEISSDDAPPASP